MLLRTLKHLFEIEGGKVSLRCSGLAFWLGFKRRVGLQTVHGAHPIPFLIVPTGHKDYNFVRLTTT